MFWNKITPKFLLCLGPYILIQTICWGENSSIENQQALNVHSLTKQAKDLHEAGLYQEVVPLYQTILHLLEDNQKSDISPLEPLLKEKIKRDIRLRLAQALFQLKDYPSAVVLLNEHQEESDYLFILGTAYRNNQEYDEAIKALESYLNSNSPELLKYSKEAEFELALAFYFKDDFLKAHELFEIVKKNSSRPRLQVLSHFYLARIELSRKNLEQAKDYLDVIAPLLTEQDLLKYELAFLQGEIHYQRQDFKKAAHFFEKALPQQNRRHVKWVEDSLYNLGMSYLKMACDISLTKKEQEDALIKAEKALSQIIEIKPNEKSWLALGEYYTIVGKRFKDETALKKADEIFSDLNKFPTEELQNQALLFHALTPFNHQLRDARFRQLTQPGHQRSSFYGKAWYYRGLNDFEEAQVLSSTEKTEDAHKLLERSVVSLENATNILKTTSLQLAAQAILLQAQAYKLLGTERDLKKALNSLDTLWKDPQNCLLSLPDPLEAYILYSYISAQLVEKNLESSTEKLIQGIQAFPDSPSFSKALNLQATLFYTNQDYHQAEETFAKLAEQYSSSSFAASALLRAAQCAEKQQKDPLIARSYRQKLLDQHPHSPLAAEAYFTLFSYQEYLQGDRQAIKHLNAFSELYPDSPYTLNAHFLMGLDLKRDRRSPEGRWLRKKNLTAAIDHFQDAESLFEELYSKDHIPNNQLEHYFLIRYRSQLEKGLVQYMISNETEGAKKPIYLEFAQETLNDLLQKLNQEQPHKTCIHNVDALWNLQEECAYWLSQAYIAAQSFQEAEKLLILMLSRYKEAKITRGYFLSRTWSALGSLSMQRQDFKHALNCFMQAEDTAKGKVLTTDQRLNLFIQQSMCYKELNQLEQAILILSKVVNDDAISSLRIKAMYLRAEIYEKQERFELARKQLEATSRKGGEWALKAKEKLDKEYGYR